MFAAQRAAQLFGLVLAWCGHKAAAHLCYEDGFAQEQWPHCHQLSENVHFYFGVDHSANVLMLGLRAAYHDSWSGGWTSVGLSGNGGMKGANIIVVRQEDGNWVAEDRHSEHYSTPALDDSQDVRLLFAEELNGGISWGIITPLDTCDEFDDPIQNISRWMLWAKGPGHAFTYHDGMRGQFHVNLMSGPPTELDFTGMEQVSLRMPNVLVEGHPDGAHPTNPYKCALFDLSQVLPGGDYNSKTHAVKMSATLSPGTERFVHHMILSACSQDMGTLGHTHLEEIPLCENMPASCQDIKWAWAKGSQPLVFPDNVAMPFGEGARWLAIQMHYYIPSLETDQRDSSGVMLTLAPSPRLVDAGLFRLNAATSMSQGIPALSPGQASLSIPSMVVPATCTNSWESELTVLGAVHHMHLIGKHMDINVTRGGTWVGTMRRERLFDFNHQSFEESAVSKLKPGDQLTMQCEYDSSTRTEDTSFGDLSQEEMCWAAVMYFPRQSFSRGMLQRPPGTSGSGSHTTGCFNAYRQGSVISFDPDPVSPPVCSREGDVSSSSADALATALGRGQNHSSEASASDYMRRRVAMLPFLVFAALAGNYYL